MTKTGKSVSGAQEAQALYREAIRHLQGNNLKEGIARLEKAISLSPRESAFHMDLATACWKDGNPEKAENHYRQAVQLDKNNAQALSNYAGFLAEQWRIKEAEALLRRALRLQPDNFEIHNNLGLALYRGENFEEAEKHFMQSIRLNPRWSISYANLGNALRELRKYPLAEESYRRAIKLAPNNHMAHSDYGLLLSTLRRDTEALEAFRRALALRRESESVWMRLLFTLERANRLEEAAQEAQEAYRLFPLHPGIMTLHAKILNRLNRTDEAVALMEDARARLSEAGRTSSFYMEFLFQLGQFYERSGETDKAFTCAAEANARQSKSREAQIFDPEVFLRAVQRIARESTPEWAEAIKRAPRAPLPEGWPAPVFLVGFPRSGTTLLDQILTSHPGIYVDEEKPAVIGAVDELTLRHGGGKPVRERGGFHECYPSALARLDDADVSALRNAFFARHAKGVEEGGNRRILVDKLPLNLVHVGIIHRLFPEAKFILALRHPCDSILSGYMQYFRLNHAMMNFLDLDRAARFYDAAFTLWEKYRAALPLDVHQIRYEDVVSDFRHTVAAMLEFLGVEWTDAVLEYDKTAKSRTINTPSYRQVTEKLYTRASGRWLRYRKHLEPILPILAPHAARYGYSMDEAVAEAAE